MKYMMHYDEIGLIPSTQALFKIQKSINLIGRTDAKAETPILWPPDAKNWLIWKDPDSG